MSDGKVSAWTQLPVSALDGIDQWHLTMLEDVVGETHVCESIIDHVFRHGHLICETIDLYEDKTTLVVINVKGPELTLTTPRGEIAFAPEQYRQYQSWIMTFASSEIPSDFPALPPGMLALAGDGVRIGDDATVTTTLGFSRDWRDWAWAWTPTYGPAILNVIVDATDEAIDAWFATHASRFYAYTRTDEHWGRRFDSKIWEGALLRLYPRRVSFIRGYHEPPPRQLAADRSLLDGLIAGALPVEGFDVIDGDYISFCATGYSAEELAGYLSADKKLKYDSDHPWKRGLIRLEVDASSATDEAGVEAQLAAKLGGESAAEHLKHTPIANLPRAIEVRHNGEVRVDALAARLLPLQPRIQWRWTAQFPRGTRTTVY